VARQVHQVAILAVLSALTGEAVAGPCGTPIDKPPATSGGGVAAIGKHLYWITGTDGAPSSHARRFDVGTKTWESIPEPSGRRLNPALVATGGVLYMIGGVGAGLTAFRDIQQFDPKTCRWRSLVTLPWASSSAMATAAGVRVVVAGGSTDNGARSLDKLDIWSNGAAAAFDAKGKVTPLPALALARGDGAAVTVGADIWVIGGRHVPKGIDTLGNRADDVEILVAGRKEWASGPALPFAAEVVAVALPDKTVVAFGRGALDSGRPAIYDPAKKTWREGKERPKSVEFIDGAAVIDGVIYVVAMEITGGFGSPKMYRVATYEPRKDRWEIVNEVPENPS
jgi:hypothetical protein